MKKVYYQWLGKGHIQSDSRFSCGLKHIDPIPNLPFPLKSIVLPTTLSKNVNICTAPFGGSTWLQSKPTKCYIQQLKEGNQFAQSQKQREREVVVAFCWRCDQLQKWKRITSTSNDWAPPTSPASLLELRTGVWIRFRSAVILMITNKLKTWTWHNHWQTHETVTGAIIFKTSTWTVPFQSKSQARLPQGAFLQSLIYLFIHLLSGTCNHPLHVLFHDLKRSNIVHSLSSIHSFKPELMLTMAKNTVALVSTFLKRRLW